jgi:dTDP-L-rhamnose 4-epimerase
VVAPAPKQLRRLVPAGLPLRWRPLPRHVLITGGAGFIGSHLVDRLLADGHEVRIVDSLDPQVHGETKRPDYLAKEAELQIGDVRDHDAVARALDGIDTVVHFAAAVGVGQSMYEIERYTAVNALGCAVLLEEVLERRAAIGRLLVASSMSIYGEGQYANPQTGERGIAPGLRPESQLAQREWEVKAEDGTPLEPEPTAESKILRPTSIYAVGKRDHEEMVLTTGAAYGIPAVALRFFNVYGERQALSNPYTGVAAIFASRLLNDRAPLVFEDGGQTRDFVDVGDIARACTLALESDGADGRTVNVGTGVPTSVREVARVIAQGLGRDIEPEIVGQYRAGDIRHCYADTRRAEALLGFRAETNFERGMGDLLAWLERQEAADRVDDADAALAARGLAR